MDSKVLSFRVPDELMEKLDRLAEIKYPIRGKKPNRTQVVLDAIELLIKQENNPKIDEQNVLSTNTYTVDKKLEALKKDILSEVERMIEDKINNKEKQLNESLSTNTYSVDNFSTMGLTEAFELAQSRGFNGASKSFSAMFSKHKNNPDYTYYGIKRILVDAKKQSKFIDVKN